jgi:hypothetical protein
VTPVESGLRIPVDLEGERTRHLLLWITALSVDIDDPNRFRARITDVEVFAAAGGDAK